MMRLSRYLVKLFAADALFLFLVAVFLVWITQALRLFDLITAKGQDMLTLLGQSALTTPPLALAIIYLCMGIGLARSLRSLQASRELHIIHSSGRTRALWSAVALFILGGVLAVSFLANWGEPWSKHAYAKWSEQVAADLVGRALSPHKFSEVVPGLVVVIGGRRADGTITDFFADDRRDPTSERTYMAKQATIVYGDSGYNISLSDGSVQYALNDGRFTEVRFSKYQLGFDTLVQNGSVGEALDQMTTPEILALPSSDDTRREIGNRLAEISRVVALALLVAVMAGFPTGRRGGERIPIEIPVLVLGLGDRVVGAFAESSMGPVGQHLGALLLLALAVIVVLVRLIGRYLPVVRWRPA